MSETTDTEYLYIIKNGNEYLKDWKDYDVLKNAKWCRRIKDARSLIYEISAFMVLDLIQEHFPEAIVLEIELREIRICENKMKIQWS